MRNLIVLLLSVLLFTSCSNVDCSCTEIEKKDGLFYRIGLKKDGDRISFGELFTGICENKDEEGKVTKHNEYTNGYLNTSKQWVKINDELILTTDLKYKKDEQLIFTNGRFDGPTKLQETSVIESGYITDITTDNKTGISYVVKYVEYDNSKTKEKWKIIVDQSCNSKVILEESNFENKSKILCESKIECLQYYPSGDELKEFLKCVSKLNLKGYWSRNN